MLYNQFLENIDHCPFCNPKSNEIIKENKKTFLTYALAPYHKHHLLIVPKRHLSEFEELTRDELHEIDLMLRQGVKILRSIGYKDYTILVRNGKNEGKTVEHLHYHIVPITLIGDLDHFGKHRKILGDNEIEETLRELKR